jgi:hypothetical protein
MAVEVDSSRKAVNVKWDKNALSGETVDLRAENPTNGDVSTRDNLTNDGYAVVTYPIEYSGQSRITITDEEGMTEEGVINV